jgi:hypothetical protein
VIKGWPYMASTNDRRKMPGIDMYQAEMLREILLFAVVMTVMLFSVMKFWL